MAVEESGKAESSSEFDDVFNVDFPASLSTNSNKKPKSESWSLGNDNTLGCNDQKVRQD